MLFLNANISSANYVAGTECIQAYRNSEVQTEHQKGKKSDLSDFEHCVVVGVRQAEYFRNR